MSWVATGNAGAALELSYCLATGGYCTAVS